MIGPGSRSRRLIAERGRKMPIYEYRCSSCRRRTSIFHTTLAAAETAQPACPRCGQPDMSRLISRFAVHRSGGDGDMGDLDDMEPPDTEDPRAMAGWMRKMKGELGEDAGPEFDEMVDRLESGESLDELENDMGDGDDDAGGAGGLDDDL